MPIELYFGNRLEHLAEKLCDHLFAENRSIEQVFEAPTVIVPNQNLAKWLQLTLAKNESIFMNACFTYLEDGLWNMLESLDSHVDKPRRLDSDTLKIVVLSALKHMNPDIPEIRPMINYISGPDGGQASNQAARLWQLTEKLSHLFQEYEFHRSSMIDMWNHGEIPEGDMEACQRYLYRNVSQRLSDYTGYSGKSIVSMRDYAESVLGETKEDQDDLATRRVIHVFGLSQISEFHLKLIGRLSSYYTIIIYALNPSQEFWEDFKTPGEKKWIKRINAHALKIQPEEIEQGELSFSMDQPLLSAWGKPGRESVRMLCDLTQYDFHACYSPEGPSKTMLQIIQNNILTLAVDKADQQDTTLQITACPSIYREVETVYNSILYNLEQDKALQMTDIAVLVPDMATYKPVFDSIFSRRPRSISYNLVDSNAQVESAYAQGVLGILALAKGRFSRKDVFDLMMNPCFMHRWGIETDQVRIWASWADKLGIFHTFDQDDKARQGYEPSDHYSWKQGLIRLRLGRLMTLPDTESGSDRFNHFSGFVPFGDIHTQDRDLVDTFCLVIETVYQAVSHLRSGPMDCAGWKAVFLNVCDRLLNIPESLKGESAIKRSLIQAFECLELYDSLTRDKENSWFDLELLTEFVTSHMGSIAGGVGDYLTSGVTISALQPMRPIPFSLVYILGMGEGNFPGRAETSSLDLRLSGRKIGDITMPERNAYLFLEILLAVREKLYISYVSRDLQKDRIIQPCSVVNQLRRYVEQDLFFHEKSFVITQIPLKGSSERYLEPEAINAMNDVMVNYSLADRISCLRSGGHWDRFTGHALAEDLKAVKRLAPDLSLSEPDNVESLALVRQITLKQLKKFLENPVHQSLRYHLGIYDEEETIEDLVLWEDEPFISEFPVDYRLKTEPVELWVEARCNGLQSGDGEMDQLFDHVYDNFTRKSQVPEGAFSIADRAALKDCVIKSQDVLKGVVERMTRAPERYRALIVGEHGSDLFHGTEYLGIKRFPPIALTVQAPDSGKQPSACQVEISGVLPWVWKEDGGGWHVLVITGSKTATNNPNKYALAPVLFFMLCLASEKSAPWFGISQVTLHVLFNDKIKEWVFNLTGEASRDYILCLVSDYLAQAMPPFLPFETVENLLPTNMAKFDDPNFIQIFNLRLEEAYSESRDPMTLLVKPDLFDDAFGAAEKRLGPFLHQFADIRAYLNNSSHTETKRAVP